MKLKLTAIGAFALIPSLVVAQQTTSDTTMRDTTVTTTSEGQLAVPSSSNLGLTTEQVKELQKAINNNGCDAGPVTGTIDDATQKGIDCIRESKHVQGSDINDVLQALGLSFTVKNAQGQNAVSDTITSDTTDTTAKSDTTTTWRSDSGAIQTDTSTVPYDSSAAHDTSVVHDTTAVPHDTSTMFQHDTTSMTRDSVPAAMPTTPPTTTTLPDTSRGKPMKP